MRKMCVICKKGFRAPPSVIKKGRRFCSIKCYRRRKTNYKKRVCRVCGKRFTVYKNKTHKRAKYLYCSLTCFGKVRRRRVVVRCSNCGRKKEITKYVFKKLNNFFCNYACFQEKKRKEKKKRVKRCLVCKNLFSAATKKRLKRQRFCSLRCAIRYRGPSTLEIETGRVLESFGKKAYSNRNPLERFVYADWWIPEKKLAIFCDGDYWHKKRKSLDKIQTKVLRTAGFRVLRIPEKIIRNPGQLEKLISKEIKKR